jgi:beta-phosphoglucomutase-like phosphatase (HAD superfamily)
MCAEPAFLFDLDCTLVDSTYQHVLAWREALEQSGIELAVRGPADLLRHLDEVGVRAAD